MLATALEATSETLLFRQSLETTSETEARRSRTTKSGPSTKRQRVDVWASVFAQVVKLEATPWVRVPLKVRVSKWLRAEKKASELSVEWCEGGETRDDQQVRLALSEGIGSRGPAYARLQVGFTPASGVVDAAGRRMPDGFVFKMDHLGLGWYRDTYRDRILRKGLVIPSSDGLTIRSKLPVARPLHAEQEGCVAWMLDAERTPSSFVNLTMETVLRPFSNQPGLAVAIRCYDEVQMSSAMLLCCTVGFGKTACALALVAVDRKAMLVVCPVHLVHQWEKEASLVVPTCTVARVSLEATSLPEADILLVSTAVLADSRYPNSRIANALETRSWPRLCLDEAHEFVVSSRFSGPPTLVVGVLNRLRVESRILLTATPPLQDLAALKRLAHLAGINVAQDAGELQHFINSFARTSDWSAREVAVESKTVICKLSRLEWLMYKSEDQFCRFGAYVERERRLLRACTQFKAEAGETDESAVCRRLRMMEAELQEARSNLANDDGESEEKMKLRVERSEASLRFLHAAMRAASGEDNGEDCSICLDRLIREAASITICGHTFHTACIQEACPFQTIGSFTERCPMCRAHLTPDAIEDASQFARPTSTTPGLPDRSRFGSKIAHILDCLREIYAAEGPAEKVVIMAQWPEVLSRLQDALAENGVSAILLSGTPESIQLHLRAFLEGVSAAESVLLLSTAEYCSGLTLTCARHLFLVHPFSAEDEREGLAFERQAVGRLWRRGQCRTVNIWRFVASNTIEEKLSKDREKAVQAFLAT